MIKMAGMAKSVQKKSVISPVMLLLLLWLGASSSCSENPPNGNDRPPNGQEEETPTEEQSEDPQEPSPSDAQAPVAIPFEVIANNPAHLEQDPNQPALRSLASGKLEQRLAQGLSLSRKTMCKEMGGFDCFGPAFLATLGNSQPRSRVLDQQAVNLPTLAPVALERIARHVCQQRISLDQALGDKAEVFTAIPLTAAEPSEASVGEQTQILYRRLLGRSATSEELAVASSVLDHQLSGTEVAGSLCFAVAASMELLLSP